DNGINVQGRPSPLGLSLATPAAFYWATLVVFLLAVGSMAVFVRSPFGASVRGTRDQPRRMNALGYHVWMIRFLAFLFSGFWSVVLGAIFVAIVVFMPDGLVPGTLRLIRRWAEPREPRPGHLRREPAARGPLQ